ncbi:hypothetical protein NQZ79_g4162 [Umbelopsis isabellina]|nr:hypothetical protein NQZ79_g4162 [Umbelopsis isabellina]
MEQSDLFANHSFYIADSEPSKDELAATIKNHGGRITDSSNDGKPVWLGTREHTKNAKELVDLTYITNCIKQKKVLPRNKYLILGGGPASRADPLLFSTRKSFTAKDKRILRDWVQRQEHFGYRLGEKIYEKLSEIHPQHPADAWQNHWKRNIEPTLTREQRMAFIKGNAAPDPVSEDEDEDEDEDKVVEQEEENNNVEETLQIVVQTESDTIETHHTDASHNQESKQATSEEHNGTQDQSSKRVTRSNTQQANTQSHEGDTGEELLQSQTSRRVLRSSVAKQTNSDSATPSSLQPAPARDQSVQDEDEESLLDPAIIQAAVDVLLDQETSSSAPSKKKGKRQAIADEPESQESSKVAKLDYSQLPSDSEEDSIFALETDESRLLQVMTYVKKYLPWNGTFNPDGKRIYYVDRSRSDLGHDAVQLMRLANLYMIELRDVSDPRWQTYTEWCVDTNQAGPHRAKSMSPDAPSQKAVPHEKSSKSRGSPKPKSIRHRIDDAPIYSKSWKQFGDDINDLHNADRTTSYETVEPRQQQSRHSAGPSTSASRQPHIRGLQYKTDRAPSHASTELRQQQPSATHSLHEETSHQQSIIDATAINEAKHIRRALTQKTYNNVSSVTDADHKRWLMDIRGLMMDYDMTAYQIIKTVRSFSGDWEAARAFLHQLKNRRGSNTSNSISGNVRIDMLLRDRDQLTRLAWSEKHDNILKEGLQSETDKLIQQKGRNNTLARQQFLKYL